MLLVLFMLCQFVATDDLSKSFVSADQRYAPMLYIYPKGMELNPAGIPADFDAMKDAGFRGFRMFVFAPFPDYETPEWDEAISAIGKGAAERDLDFGFENCGGWSHAGGPWITAEQSVKALTWEGINIGGGETFSGNVPQPNSEPINFYRDIALLAFPLPETTRLNGPGSVSPKKFEPLVDLDESSTIDISKISEDLVFDLKKRSVIRSIKLKKVYTKGRFLSKTLSLSVSDDGQSYKKIAQPVFWRNKSEIAETHTISLPETRARYLKITLDKGGAKSPIMVGEIEISDAMVINYREMKAAMKSGMEWGQGADFMNRYPQIQSCAETVKKQAIPVGEIIDLSDLMEKDGKLEWTAPSSAKQWRLLRVGYRATGKETHPAPPSLEGYESDKLDRKAVRHHLDSYVGKMLNSFPPDVRKKCRFVHVDSWESEVSNWTRDFEKRFQENLEYDLLRFLPLLTEGHIIDNMEVSEAVLYDWRNFVSRQIAEECYGEFGRFAKENNLLLSGQPMGRQQYLYNPYAYSRGFDVIQGEFWGSGRSMRPDIRMSGSVASILGGMIAGSEAFTAAGMSLTPADMKKGIDLSYASGISSHTFHVYSPQPYETRGPGFNAIGGYFHRKNTMWPYFHNITAYQSRSSFMLQQGNKAADFLYLSSEDVPLYPLKREYMEPLIPAGTDFDQLDCGTFRGAKFENGYICFSSGARYKSLILPSENAVFTYETLLKIDELIQCGVPLVLGEKPTGPPDYNTLKKSADSYREMVNRIWDNKSPNVYKERAITTVMDKIDLPPDLEYKEGLPPLGYTHRRVDNSEIYFLSSLADSFKGEVSFRTSGLVPELWDAVTGTIKDAPWFKQDEKRTTIDLELKKGESIFVVFRKKVTPAVLKAASIKAEPKGRIAREITGPWEVSFSPELGGPEKVTFTKLTSYTNREEEGIRYYSGTAVYRKEIELEASWLNNKPLFLDLGQVDALAEVHLNGKKLAELWNDSKIIDISEAARVGENELVVKVVNTWDNRILGEMKKFGAKGAIQSADQDWFGKSLAAPGHLIFAHNVKGKLTKPLSAGLIGPVQLVCFSAGNKGESSDELLNEK